MLNKCNNQTMKRARRCGDQRRDQGQKKRQRKALCLKRPDGDVRVAYDPIEADLPAQTRCILIYLVIRLTFIGHYFHLAGSVLIYSVGLSSGCTGTTSKLYIPSLLASSRWVLFISSTAV